VAALVAALLVSRDGGDPPLTAQWQLEVGADLSGAPVVVGRTVLLSTVQGSVVAAGLLDGRARWRFASGGDPALPLAGAGDVVLLASGGDLFAIDVRTGAERWRSPGLGAVSLAVVGNAAYVSTGAGDAVAFDLATGAERWRRPVPVAGTVAVADGVVVVAKAGGMEALDAATGEPRWSWSGAGPGPPVPLAVDHVVVLEGDAGELIAIALADGTERWRAPSGPSPSPPAGGGAVVVRSGPDEVVAVAADTGRIRWRGGPPGASVATDGTLVAAAVPDRLRVLDADTGETDGATDLPAGTRQPTPVVAGLQVLVAAGDRLLSYSVP
jgi:outer membrane protein assembly factor BamB